MNKNFLNFIIDFTRQAFLSIYVRRPSLNSPFCTSDPNINEKSSFANGCILMFVKNEFKFLSTNSYNMLINYVRILWAFLMFFCILKTCLVWSVGVFRASSDNASTRTLSVDVLPVQGGPHNMIPFLQII